ncbi:1-deoxy-D-xylulose-5-phosphate reductoisomerase [Desulfomicrobium sp. ZS1]|uniref:1-deoxy-D-xylulose-5-phosphate reductoisomerase n=1 Tax=Desulfomicrobium sp. ZS1 TaxID=2952228 RepID=UPI0020B37906|nr:1-deoxy-D-xylulose-5-phosphate reductoisomerase [Desulfomicrobium sp. ZS1]UTF50491.1 1-deoxy-D-xylulose-5-phosphate reductoisomerase [Desulfomicrobium sp. ZS1]
MKYISGLSSPVFDRPGQRTLAILGSTGSIGTSALRVVAKNTGDLKVVALAGARNVALLARQAETFRPAYLGILDEDKAEELRALLPGGYAPRILVGQNGYTAMATLPEADLILAAQVGAAGLVPALAAARAGKVLCLANKEALVLAGDLFRRTCQASGAVILPVDSEHNALFQAYAGHEGRQACRLILTASGGPFRAKSLQEIQAATPAQALKHPNWSMGAKISIDSATMMNKGLEIIEAVHLYGASLDEVDVVVHPQSIVHSLVEYEDGSQLAHLGMPDMEIPIGYCLGYPHRLNIGLERLDLAKVGTLTFETPDLVRFPCLNLAREALSAGPSHPVVLNAANEIAVQAFLDSRISFPGIARLIEQMLAKHSLTSMHDLEDILDLDAQTRTRSEEAIGKYEW